ncbi:MAG: hypothetical protein ACLT8I_23670, partial [Blautia faecis]
MKKVLNASPLPDMPVPSEPVIKMFILPDAKACLQLYSFASWYYDALMLHSDIIPSASICDQAGMVPNFYRNLS